MVSTSLQIKSYDEYKEKTKLAKANPDAFWESIAQHFVWNKKWESVRAGNFAKGDSSWFIGGKLNITENCIDRHLKENANKIAYIVEPNATTPVPKKITYRDLYESMCDYAYMLKEHGLQKGDCVCIYMPLIPEAIYAMLACARLGIIHTVVFSGFSATSLANRISDAKCKAVITCDSMQRGTTIIPLKEIVDQALTQTKNVEHVFVLKHTNLPITINSNTDKWVHEHLPKTHQPCPAQPMDAEDPLFILYTSGSTGKPKGMLHTCAGYMIYAQYSFENVFQCNQSDIYWCTADIGWITGHTYVVYAPLLQGITSVLFEGIPTYPDASVWWKLVEKHKVTVFYTAPTAIRALMAKGDSYLTGHNLSSLKTLGSVGEPINQEAWQWYYEKIGGSKCSLVDTWWQTETGGILISGLAGISKLKPTYAGEPLPGIEPIVVNSQTLKESEPNTEGLLFVKSSWPSIARTINGDHQAYLNTYFSNGLPYYFTGDEAKKDENGFFRILGRADDVINVSAHRFGTAEIEDAINKSKYVIESAVVGCKHPIKGEGIYAFVVCKQESKNIPFADKQANIENTVIELIGKIAKPEKIQFVQGLPKTRSGKIMRRILKLVVKGEKKNFGDITTLVDPLVVDDIASGFTPFE
jgi:acetyl-CoA synthetase